MFPQPAILGQLGFVHLAVDDVKVLTSFGQQVEEQSQQAEAGQHERPPDCEQLAGQSIEAEVIERRLDEGHCHRWNG